MQSDVYKVNHIGKSVYLTSKITDSTNTIKHFVIGRYDKNNIRDILNVNAIDEDNTVYLKQIHSNRFYVADEKNYKNLIGCEGDALITYTPGITLKIFTADCVPVAVFDNKKKVVALVHAGWRGTYKKILYNVLLYLIKNGSKVQDINCIIGPSIGPCCFEVGDDVAEKFNFKKKVDGKYHVDLWMENKKQIIDAKIPERNIFMSQLCTCCNNDFLYSYRKEGKAAERIITFIQLMKR